MEKWLNREREGGKRMQGQGEEETEVSSIELSPVREINIRETVLEGLNGPFSARLSSTQAS